MIPQPFVVYGFGTQHFGVSTLVSLGFTYSWAADIRTTVMASSINGFKLALADGSGTVLDKGAGPFEIAPMPVFTANPVSPGNPPPATRTAVGVACVLLAVGWLAAQTPPDKFLGHKVGEDRKLADYTQIKAYFEKLAQETNKLKLFTIGESTLKKPMIMAAISTPENLAKLDRWKDIVIYGGNSLINMVLDDGFDGVYLDWIEAYRDETIAATAERITRPGGK
jgi:hypothetical protein